jgi:NAD-dependent DNA ligase
MAKQGTSILTALRGKKLVFQGKFDCGQEDLLHGMAQAQGGTIADEPDASTDYLVLADLAGGKTIQKKVASLNTKPEALAAELRTWLTLLTVA